MGLLDGLKAAARALTGGGATLTLEAEPLDYNNPFRIRVKVHVADNDVDARGAYLKLEGMEDVHLRGVTVNSGDEHRTRDLHESNRTFLAEYVLAEPQVLPAGSSHEWTLEVSIPAGAPPIYRGVLAHHRIRALAGIDCSGNDPDSGWVDLQQQA